MIKKLFTKKEKTSLNYESEYLKQSIDTSGIINTRFVIFMVVIAVLMGLLLYRLFNVQVMNQGYYEQKLAIYTSRKQTVTTPRGEILASDGKVLVGNTQRINVTYFPPQNVTELQEWNLANQFVKDFDFDISLQTSRDLKDLYLQIQTTAFSSWVKTNDYNQYEYLISEENKVNYKNLVNEEAMKAYYAGQLNDNDIYQLRLSAITDEMIDRMDTDLRKVWACKQAMDLPTSGQSKIIMSDLTMEQTAAFIENSETYPGFNIEVDWERYYPYSNLLKGVLGGVTTSKQGLPAENLDYYLALGYSRNEKIGKSGLEKQYEDLLSGQKAVFDLSYDENGVGLFKESLQGNKGYDLMTSFDLDLQVYIEKLLQELLVKVKDDPYRTYMNKINVVIQNPKTGDVLAMVNVTRDENGDYFTDPMATYTMAFEPGSIIKGATVYMGLNEGVVNQNEYILDQPIKLKSSPIKKSWQNLGSVNDTQALARSSNVYMFNIAMRLAGTSYYYDGPLYVKDGTFNKMRNYYSLFGLGVKTGIDVPNESVGYTGINESGGLILDYAIGQYDTYTTLQISQYIATIANGGTRVQPRIVKEAYAPGTSNKVFETEIKVLSVADNQMAIKRVQQGFWECANSKLGICYGFGPLKNDIAAKTGTAEAYIIKDGQTIDAPHNSVVAYYPYQEPQISTACLIPNAWNGDKTQSNLCLELTNKIIHAYAYKDYSFGLNGSE